MSGANGNGHRRNHLAKRRRRAGSSGGFRVLTRAQLLELLDHNTRKFLKMDAREFLKKRRDNRPVESLAWGPIDMLAALLPDERAARRAIDRSERTVLSGRDSERVLELLENPPKPTPALIAAAR